jgi:glutathione S-transferase
MKLYYAPLACSLADHIALVEAGVPFQRERVDLRTKMTESGRQLAEIAGKSYVPVLVLDDDEVLTENIAILDWIAGRYASLATPGSLGRTRLLEMLTFISTEIHRAFKPFWHSSTAADRERAGRTVTDQLQYIASRLDADYIFGAAPTVADFYLFVMLLWAQRFDVTVPATLVTFRERLAARPSVREAMRREGIA